MFISKEISQNHKEGAHMEAPSYDAMNIAAIIVTM